MFLCFLCVFQDATKCFSFSFVCEYAHGFLQGHAQQHTGFLRVLSDGAFDGLCRLHTDGLGRKFGDASQTAHGRMARVPFRRT